MTIGIPLGHAIRIVDAVNQPLPVRCSLLHPYVSLLFQLIVRPLQAADRNGDSLVDRASPDALLQQSAAVSLIASDPAKMVARLKTLLKEGSAELKETTRDTETVVRASLPPTQFRNVLESAISLSPVRSVLLT